MIAMQYSFTLPADYDMTTIDRRVRDKGPLLDGFPLLIFKSYLTARKQDDGFASADNLYAPFYLWAEPEGVSNFLTSPGFAGLVRDYGWPTVRTWLVWHTEIAGDLSDARFASRDIETIDPYTNLATFRVDTAERARIAVKDGALAAVVGFNPTEWTLVRFHLWRELPADIDLKSQLYRVGHLSAGSVQ